MQTMHKDHLQISTADRFALSAETKDESTICVDVALNVAGTIWETVYVFMGTVELFGMGLGAVSHGLYQAFIPTRGQTHKDSGSNLEKV